MKHRFVIIVAVALAAVVAVLYVRAPGLRNAEAEHASSDVDGRHAAEPSVPEVSIRPVVPRIESASSAAESHSISHDFARATDYLDFANSMLDRAKSGDAAAQYYLYAVLNYCDEEYRAFFRRVPGPTRTLDEALNRVSTRPAESIEVVRIAYTRCSRLFDGGDRTLGTAEDWLRLATGNGQPLALATTAQKLLSSLPPGSVGDGAPAPGSAAMAAKDMLARALRSKDPAVMWIIGENQTLFGGDDGERMLRQWSWWLAACQRGYDCDHSRWLEFSCRFDQLCAQDRNAIDFIRRTTDLDFPEIEHRAREINANLDSESWGALGFVGALSQ